MAEVFEKGSHKGSANGISLERQVTLTLSPEQYERLFFQPSPPVRGDLSQRFGNPTLLGTLAFLIPFTTTMLCSLQWGGASGASFTSISGSWYMVGGIGMILAGIGEFILGNTFPFVAFTIFGTHWLNAGYAQDPLMGIIASYNAGALPGADTVAYTSGQGFYYAVMSIVSACLFLGSLRSNIPFCIAVLFICPTFALLSAVEFATGTATTAEDVAHILVLLRASGACGLVGSIAGWYLAIILSCATTGVPCPLPVGDLSHLLWNNSRAADLERGRGPHGHGD